jgi:hypothetical protein
MKNLTITLSQTQYDLACLRLLDPQVHLQNFANCMVQNAMQEFGFAQQPGGGYTDEDINSALALPSASQRQAEQEARQQKILEKEAVKAEQKDAIEDAQRKQEIELAADVLLQARMPAILTGLRQDLDQATKSALATSAIDATSPSVDHNKVKG